MSGSWQRKMFAAVAESGTDRAERQLLLAAINWANRFTGELWPSVAEWSKTAGLSERGFQEARRRLVVANKMKALSHGLGGHQNPTVYQIPMLAVDAERGAPDAPLSTPHAKREGAHAMRGRGAPDALRGAPDAPKQSEKNQMKNQQQPARSPDAVALLALGLDEKMLRHANATPERLAWIASVAREKNNPAGWAAQAIREAWNPPTVAPGGAGGINKAERAKATVAGLSDEQYAQVLETVRREYPNLSGYADDSSPVVGAMARIVNGAGGGGIARGTGAARNRDDDDTPKAAPLTQRDIDDYTAYLRQCKAEQRAREAREQAARAATPTREHGAEAKRAAALDALRAAKAQAAKATGADGQARPAPPIDDGRSV